ncbi:MAG: septal ring lytic transglycosylase RlpA family protein [Meiothermus sp.]|nr:septal ring lytic transglycosylase RlpA family protein [Meiothermus sp.]
MRPKNLIAPLSWRTALPTLLCMWGLAFAQTTDPEARVYTVQFGDTLESIALEQGLSVEELRAANLMGVDEPLIEGATLILPADLELLVPVEIPLGQDMGVALEFVPLPWAPAAPVLPAVPAPTPRPAQQAQRQIPQPAQPARVVPPPALQLPVYQLGWASWYGPRFHGRLTANGERFNTYAMTAAHRYLPFNTRVVVTNLINGRNVTVRINDRGPFIRGRIIDLSFAAARQLGFYNSGITRVSLRIIR